MERELVHFTMLKIDFKKALSGEGTLSEGAVEVEEEAEPSFAWNDALALWHLHEPSGKPRIKD